MSKPQINEQGGLERGYRRRTSMRNTSSLA